MVLAEDLQRYLAEHGMPCRFQGASGISVDGFSSLFHYRPGTMTFIVPERSFSDYAADFQPGEIDLLAAHAAGAPTRGGESRFIRGRP